MTEEPQIRIKKINHATIKILCDIDIALEISETFQFFVDGYKYSPKFKLGVWDGKIRLFNLGTRTIGSGLFNQITEFASKRGYSYDVIDDSGDTGYEHPNYTYDITFDQTKQYMESLNLYAHDEPLMIREYQIKGVYTALKERSAILLACTGSGKSAMIYSIFRYVTDKLGLRCLLIVPTVSLVSQIQSDFKDYSSHNGYDVDKNMHLISAGVDKNSNKPIVISTFQSLNGISPAWVNSFGLIMSDEGHKIKADSFKSIYDVAINVPYRLACTGTLHDTKCDLLQMQSITGNIHEIALAKDLIRVNQLVPLKVKAISLNYAVDVCKTFLKVVYEDEINWLISYQKRNNFIKNLAIRCAGTTLVLFRFTDHGKELYSIIKESIGETREVFYVDGDVKKDERELIRVEANNSDSIIVASLGCFSTGINLPSIENIIIAQPIKSKITFLQSIGRSLRLKEGKSFATLYDIGDNLSYKSKVNFAYKHFGERLTLLTAEGYDFTITNLSF